ncbi:hypothetical protein T4D_1302 [Trichinella pseudospiralis]|uniref:Uncharacterized protein n=1 Tax=Trichinella pseudospiralis TaxID=6337 RepID=A0A0V1FE49_TRIPS|nr:hypothetical protein T4D_1302 [Trichinella pseudospiralis]
MTKNKENAQPSSKSERLNSWKLLMMNMIIRERARTMDDGQRQQKKGRKNDESSSTGTVTTGLTGPDDRTMQ